MRSLCLLAVLCCPLAQAEALVKVESNSLLRLPTTTSVLLLDRLEVADHGTLLIPSSLNEIRVGELRLGRDARIAIAPSAQAFRLQVVRAELGAGSHINARGATGTQQQPATAGRNLSVRLESVTLAELTLDARGGVGAPGYRGLDGADGDSAGCTWGQASRGYDGQNGGNGQSGAAGGQVRLEVPEEFPAQLLHVRLDGGAGGAAGEAGSGGAGGAAKGCLFYRAAGARAGRPGQPGQPGAAGSAGSFNLVRFGQEPSK
ncbi:collagen-like protein [Pseudomonas sp. 2FG]|uniref:collagen-like protein n=1 Tax=Pseudomonas sp. 2FG TaxID=2502191 RepID=UPI0010F5C105|nr:collagen-like protein [Pseudomonas sp. 2FG]